MKINKKNNDNNIDDITVKYKSNSGWTKKTVRKNIKL